MEEETLSLNDAPECTAFGINPKSGNLIIQRGYNKVEIKKEDAKILSVILTNIILKNE